MPYRTPGVKIINQFEPLVNPAVGGDRLLAIVAGFDSKNLNFYPIKRLNLRRSSKAPFDFVTTTRPFPYLPSEGLTDTDRFVSLMQNTTSYKRLPTTGSVDNNNYVYTRNSKTFFKLLKFTRDKYQSNESVTFTIANQPFRGEGNTSTTGTDLVYGSDGKRYLFSYNPIQNSFSLFKEDEDFTIDVEAYNTTQIKVTVTWLKDPGIEDGGFYYGLYRDMNSTNISYEKEDDLWYSVLKYNDTNITTATNSNYDYLVIPFFGSGDYAQNVGYVIYFIKDNSNFGITPDNPVIPSDSSVYNLDTRIEVLKGANIYTSYSEVLNYYGSIFDVASNSINEPVMAAWIAFSEGAPYIMLSVYDINVASTIDEAFNDLAVSDLPNIITTTSNSLASESGEINKKLFNHVVECSSDTVKKYRVGIYHPYKAKDYFDGSVFSTILNNYDNETAAVDSNRMILVGPAKVSFNVPVPPTGLTRTFTFNGKYLGVVLGAMMCRPEYDIATSMTRKASRTIVNLGPVFDDIKLDKIASKAVTLFSKVNGQWTVRDDITTSRLNQLMLSEPTITLVSDDIAKSTIQILDRALIGAKIRIPTVLEAIKARILGMLDIKARDGIISAYGTPQLSVDPNDPRKILVTVPIQPIFTLKYIDVTFSYVSRL